jgi:hypothetical protein
MTVALLGELELRRGPGGVRLGGALHAVACHLQGLQFHAVIVTRTPSGADRHAVTDALAGSGLDSVGVQEERPVGGPPGGEPPGESAFDRIHAGMARLAMLAAAPRALFFDAAAQRSLGPRRALSAMAHAVPALRFADLGVGVERVACPQLERALGLADIACVSRRALHALGVPDPAQDGGSGGRVLGTYGLKRLFVADERETAFAYAEHGSACACGVGAPGCGALVRASFDAVLIVGSLLGWSPRVTLERALQFEAETAATPCPEACPPGLYARFVRDWQIEPA